MLKSKFLDIAEDFGLNAEPRQMGRIEFAVPYARINPEGGYDLLDNSESLNAAVKAIEESQFEELLPKATANPESNSIKARISQVWENPINRKEIICIACVASVITVVGAVALAYYKNRKNNLAQTSQSTKKQLADATKKAVKSPKTWLATAGVTTLACGLTLWRKMSIK